jgi:predicted transcriptional regulator of viral defense system
MECRGVLSDATALDLHDLCDVNPSRIDVTVPRGFRTTREPPAAMRLHREDLIDDGITWHQGLPIVTVYRAIEGSIVQGVGWNLIEQAIDTARRTGRLTAASAGELRALRPGGPEATDA